MRALIIALVLFGCSDVSLARITGEQTPTASLATPQTAMPADVCSAIANRETIVVLSADTTWGTLAEPIEAEPVDGGWLGVGAFNVEDLDPNCYTDDAADIHLNFQDCTHGKLVADWRRHGGGQMYHVANSDFGLSWDGLGPDATYCQGNLECCDALQDLPDMPFTMELR